MSDSSPFVSHQTVLLHVHDGVQMHGDFEEIVGVDPTDTAGLIPLAVSLAPLECRISQWIPGPSPGRVDTLKLWWRIQGIDVLADEFAFTGPLNPADFPYSLYVPADYMRELDAVVQVYFTIVDETGFVTPSAPYTLTIDNNPPKFAGADDTAQFVDPDIAMTGITQAVLAANPFIEFLVPDYIGRDGRDQVGYYLDHNVPPVPSIQKGRQTFVFIDEPLVLRIPADDFRTLKNGPNHLQYRLYDRAGNFSGYSAPLTFQVALIAIPSNLSPPQVRPPAYDDSLIVREDARATVAAGIPTQYDDFAPGDSVVLIWDGRQILPPQPITVFPSWVNIPWNILRPVGGLIREQVQVSYEIHRAGIAPVPSPANFFWVDLTIAGQDHANAPARLNQTLPVVDVFGLGSGLHNELDVRDESLGAQVWVQLYVGPVAGERLTLHWGTVGAVAHYDVQPGDVFNQPVRFLPDVPGSVITSGGNHPQLPVFYTTSNGVNEQDSPSTLVNVHIDPLIVLSAPIIQHTLHGGAQYLTCDSRPPICEGVIWQVPHDPSFQLNDVIEFNWEGYTSNNGSGPSTPGTDFSATVPLSSPADVANGVRITVLPWDTKIEPMRNYASAFARYRLLRGGVPIGSSIPRLLRIDRVFAGSGKVCNPGDVGFCDGS
ncbi:hypothetical protein SB759_02855 [Pseudomonas sp. SIMBA_059]